MELAIIIFLCVMMFLLVSYDLNFLFSEVSFGTRNKSSISVRNAYLLVSF